MTLHLALKIALAAALGLAVAQALDLPYPEYAVLAAATVTDVHAGPSAVLGVLRMVGSAVGVGFSVLLVEVTGVSPWSVGAASLIAIGTCVLVRSAAAARLSIIVLGVGTLGIGDGVEAWAGDRLLTTGVGVVVTVIISAVPWPSRQIDAFLSPLRRLHWPRRIVGHVSPADQHRLTRAGIVSEE
jgi:uncharacterized membrane protein YgaE (UPF0421/DUF939 family)